MAPHDRNYHLYTGCRVMVLGILAQQAGWKVYRVPALAWVLPRLTVRRVKRKSYEMLRGQEFRPPQGEESYSLLIL
jgi:hypothetical protein